MNRRSWKKLTWLLAGLPLVIGASAFAQDAESEDIESVRKEVDSLWPVEAMMKQAAENISRRYNLNEKQRQYTHKMLTEEVSRFLDNHDDVWPLIRDLARYQAIGKNPEGEVAQRIGDRAAPLIAEIREAILDGNERWREILTDEQKKLHDWDLQDMEKTFAKMESRFYAMSEGASSSEPVFPVNSNDGKPPRPRKADPNFTPEPPNPVAKTHNEDWWDGYVHEFIRRHGLDDTQSESALSILREMKHRARQYRISKQEEFGQIDGRLREANATSDPKLKQTKVRIWMQIQKKLNKPILDMFEELKDRLDRIPTDSQKRKANTLRKRPDKTKQRTASRKPPADKTPAPAKTTEAKPAETKADTEPAAKPAAEEEEKKEG